MKNLMMTVAAATMLFATQGISAQTDTAMNTETSVTMKTEYTAVEVDSLPEAISQAVETDFAGSSIKEAYIDDKEEKYKLVLETEAGAETHKVYITKEGEWVKEDDSQE